MFRTLRLIIMLWIGSQPLFAFLLDGREAIALSKNRGVHGPETVAVGHITRSKSASDKCMSTGTLIFPNVVLTASHSSGSGITIAFRIFDKKTQRYHDRKATLVLHNKESDLSILVLDAPILGIPPARIATLSPREYDGSDRVSAVSCNNLHAHLEGNVVFTGLHVMETSFRVHSHLIQHTVQTSPPFERRTILERFKNPLQGVLVGGDSGGPLFIERYGSHKIIGVAIRTNSHPITIGWQSALQCDDLWSTMHYNLDWLRRVLVESLHLPDMTMQNYQPDLHQYFRTHRPR